MLSGLLPSHCTWSFGQIGTCHSVTKHVERTPGGFHVSCLLTWLSLIRRNGGSLLYFHCLCLLSSIQLKGKKGSTVPGKKWCYRGSWKLNSDTSNSRCSTTSAGSKNSSMLQSPFIYPALLHAVSLILHFMYMSAFKITGLFTAELWMKQKSSRGFYFLRVHSR